MFSSMHTPSASVQALLDAIASMDLTGDAQRIFHGRGGLHPGCEHWTLDAFPPVMVLTSFQPSTDDELAGVHAALSARWQQMAPEQPLNWIYQCRHKSQTETRLMAGTVPSPHIVTEGGARYIVHLLKGQNHGFFPDMAQGRRWVREHVVARPGTKVLNLFAYTCAFSVVALQAGARQVVNVDMSHGAMATGQQNHQLNGLATGASFWAHDIFSTWGKIQRGGPYDLIIVDPPSYQKGSFVATKDYVRVLRRLPELWAPGAQLLLCLNAPELDCAYLQELMREAAPEFTFVQRIANPPAFADASPERSLKVLLYQAPASYAMAQTVSNPVSES
jgi:23S rRNA (cytosine1962-C5)-methyltransferase